MQRPSDASNTYMPIHQWCGRRERGLVARFGDADSIHRTIYRALEPKKIWNDPGRFPGIVRDYGGTFNLEFSPDGSLLAAACEKKSIVLFDPLTEIQICAVKNAHSDCVNSIKFINERIFATCSDDTTVALWDIRNLTTKIITLVGHSGWVKNVEYSKRDGLLLSSGFDGSMYAWEVNNGIDYGSVYWRVLHTSGLLRSRLSPDENRMVLSMSSGFMIIIHDLDLANLESDLDGFYPNVYRLMQDSRQLIPKAVRFRHMFYPKRKKNRIELVTDFPPDNHPEMIGGLVIHPQGWCTLSRNVSIDETSEWSVVHDIQEISQNDNMDEDEEEDMVERENEGQEESEDERTEEPANNNTSGTDALAQPSTSGTDIWATEVTYRERKAMTTSHARNRGQIYGIVSGVCSSARAGYTGAGKKRVTKAVASNTPRMLYYIQESNMNQGYLKESCFSPDGRVICSPYDNGFRLLAFNENCNELQHATDIGRNGSPQLLQEVKRKQCHSSLVVSSQFSPRFPLLVTGCLLGKIVWHQPTLN
uniref:Uncharacterized protein n=1 Tax=Anopheles dirus TaxID=7168 RepID=A0A182N8M0_9DIPT